MPGLAPAQGRRPVRPSQNNLPLSNQLLLRFGIEDCAPVIISDEKVIRLDRKRYPYGAAGIACPYALCSTPETLGADDNGKITSLTADSDSHLYHSSIRHIEGLKVYTAFSVLHSPPTVR
jgi:hypothetical protein